ncbi:hypothetical protein [Chondrinema litorale]|uniref:hypothetical protein n=1 Tax=Chondrinema litorale TaxID=2994555 RepID=UPI002543BC8B|nr:hypothetical protein [Chondrinema litorale]UZR99377.1 hypothetical protein OQ292_35940 [Chondrinema litorale]
MTSLTEIQEIEAYLQGKMQAEDQVVFEAKMLIDENLKDNVFWQKHTFELVQFYGRKNLRNRLETVHQQLFTKPQHKSFRQKVLQLFSKL